MRVLVFTVPGVSLSESYYNCMVKKFHTNDVNVLWDTNPGKSEIRRGNLVASFLGTVSTTDDLAVFTHYFSPVHTSSLKRWDVVLLLLPQCLDTCYSLLSATHSGNRSLSAHLLIAKRNFVLNNIPEDMRSRAEIRFMLRGVSPHDLIKDRLPDWFL